MAKFELRDYQKLIISELKHLPSLALYMGTGTGKTVTALELVRYNPSSELLVVCPRSAITQWKTNILEHAPNYNIIELKQSWTSKRIEEELITASSLENKAIIINYDMLHRIPFIKVLISSNWTIIADEIHRIKNWGTKTRPVKATRFMVEISKNTPYKIGLSATPTQGKFGGYIDYYPQLLFLGYTDLTYEQFYKKHVITVDKHYGMPFPIKEITGYRAINEIDNLLQLIARRYKPSYEDFEPQFNKINITRTTSYPKMLREKAYRDILLNNSARARIAKKTMTTGRVMGHDMEGNTFVYDDNCNKIDWLEDFLTDTDEVVVVLYQYNVELDLLKELAKKLKKKYIVINGLAKDRYNLVKKGDYDIIIGQFQAMSEALDGVQYKSHIEVFFSMPESSLIYTQAIGRIDRIGQTSVPMYYFLIMEKTIDEVIMYNIEQKIEFSEATLELLEV